MAASYGRLARFRSEQRIHKVHNHCIVGASGDFSDFQEIQHLLETLMIKEDNYADGHQLSVCNVYDYLRNVMYARRSKFNPFWNQLVVAGVDHNEYIPNLMAESS